MEAGRQTQSIGPDSQSPKQYTALNSNILLKTKLSQISHGSKIVEYDVQSIHILENHVTEATRKDQITKDSSFVNPLILFCLIIISIVSCWLAVSYRDAVLSKSNQITKEKAQASEFLKNHDMKITCRTHISTFKAEQFYYRCPTQFRMKDCECNESNSDQSLSRMIVSAKQCRCNNPFPGQQSRIISTCCAFS